MLSRLSSKNENQLYGDFRNCSHEQREKVFIKQEVGGQTIFGGRLKPVAGGLSTILASILSI
jgi:hypothetical protein